MSHHLDSPIARQDIRLDITDLYAFRGETGTDRLALVPLELTRALKFPGLYTRISGTLTYFNAANQ